MPGKLPVITDSWPNKPSLPWSRRMQWPTNNVPHCCTHKLVSMSIKRAMKAMIKGSTVLGEQGLKILSLSSFPGVFAAFHGVPFGDAGDWNLFWKLCQQLSSHCPHEIMKWRQSWHQLNKSNFPIALGFYGIGIFRIEDDWISTGNSANNFDSTVPMK